jgi:hypothetical protein
MNGYYILKSSKMTVKDIAMYYDEYERLHGDGFYPSPEPMGDEYSGFVSILFKLNESDQSWNQISGQSFDGLDGDYGIKLLNKLNDGELFPATKIYSSARVQLYPKLE